MADSFETLALTNNIAQVRLFQGIFEDRAVLRGQEGTVDDLTAQERGFLLDMLLEASDENQISTMVGVWENTLANPSGELIEKRCPLVIGCSQGSLIVNRA